MTARASTFNRICNIISNLGVAWFGLVSGWGMFGAIGGGHYASLAGTTLVAENMLQWKILGPVLEYTATKPTPASYYCHHPFGCYFVNVPTVGIFGHHDWVIFLPSVIMSTLTALFISRTARNFWGPLGGAAATLGFVTLPITLAFANYGVLEVTTMFGWAMFFWGYSAMLKTWKLRYLVASLAGVFMAAVGDWIGYIAPGVFLVWTLFRVLLLPERRILPKLRTRRFTQWWAIATGLLASLLMFWLILFYSYGKLTELFSQADVRASGTAIPLKDILAARAYRIDTCFTPPVILLGKLAVGVAVLRVIVCGFFTHKKLGPRQSLALGMLVGLFLGGTAGFLLSLGVTTSLALGLVLGLGLAIGMGPLSGLVRRPLGAPAIDASQSDAEIISLAVLVAATVQYLGFKQGADVHVFWPHYYGFYFAFVFAQVALSLRWVFQKLIGLARRLWERIAGDGDQPGLVKGFEHRFAPIIALGMASLFVLYILPDALNGLRTGRETWGRFNEERLRSETDLFRVLKMLSPRLPPGAILDTHNSIDWHGHAHHAKWALHGLQQDVSGLPTRDAYLADTHPFWMARASFLVAGELERLTKEFYVEFFGDIVFVDRRRAPAPLDAYVWEEHEPNLIEWYLYGGTEPVRKLVRDPFATWEWRTMLGQEAVVPVEEPQSLDQIRVAHNIAVEAGDEARAAEMRAKIDAAIEHDVTEEYTQGVKLVGTRHIRGASPRLQLWFLAGAGPTQGDAGWGVHARMMGPASFSTVPPDELYRDLTLPVPWPMSRWRMGHLYSFDIILYHRIGLEKYDGGFFSRDGKPSPTRAGSRGVTIDLLTID